jgi:hypothetical protein
MNNWRKVLSWEENLKILRAVKVPEASWFWATEGEIVLPEVITNDFAFHGVNSRKGTKFAIVSSEPLDSSYIRELAEKEVKKFWGDDIKDVDFDKLVDEKVRYIQKISDDLQTVPNGSIVTQVDNPESGPNWFEIRIGEKSNVS